MNPLHDVAEAKIREAIDKGLFDNLSTEGKPVEIEIDRRVPAELRGSYTVLKNAGMLPEEMELKKSMVTLRDLIDAATDGDEKANAEARLRHMSLRFEILMEKRRGVGLGGTGYGGAVSKRLFER